MDIRKTHEAGRKLMEEQERLLGEVERHQAELDETTKLIEEKQSRIDQINHQVAVLFSGQPVSVPTPNPANGRRGRRLAKGTAGVKKQSATPAGKVGGPGKGWRKGTTGTGKGGRVAPKTAQPDAAESQGRVELNMDFLKMVLKDGPLDSTQIVQKAREMGVKVDGDLSAAVLDLLNEARQEKICVKDETKRYSLAA
jgi:hypothetical protein